MSSFFFNFLISYLSMANNVVIVSSAEQRDSAIHMYLSILPQTTLPSRLPHNTEQSCFQT